MQPEPHYHFRPFEDADYPLFKEWRARRGLESPDCSWIPETSFACLRQDDETHEQLPMGFISLYFDPTCGVGHIDWLTIRPNTSLNEAHDISGRLLKLCSLTAERAFPGKAILIGCVQSPAMANAVRKHGFTPTEQVTMILKEVEPVDTEPWPPQ